MSANGKVSTAVFAVALAVRLLTLAVVLPKLRPDADPDLYRSLARNLAAGKGLVATAADGRALPSVARTPAYPVFLATLIRIGGDGVGLFLLAQCVLGALTCALAVRLAARWLSARASLLAGALVAFDPNSVLRCADLRTETLFTLLLIAGAIVIVWRTNRAWSWFASGLLWALAALTRPIAVWIWVVPSVMAAAQRTSRRQRVLCLAAFLFAYLPVEGIWVARNAALTGHAFVSTISTYNLLMYRAAGVEAERSGQELAAVQQQFLKEFGDIQFFDDRAAFDGKLRSYKRTSARILLSAPAVAVRQTGVGWGKVLFGPGERGIENMLREPGGSHRWWPPLYTVGLAIVFVLCVWGAIKFGREMLLVWLVALYFVVVAGGPEGNSRFRTPITPLLAVLAAAGTARKTT